MIIDDTALELSIEKSRFNDKSHYSGVFNADGGALL